MKKIFKWAGMIFLFLLAVMMIYAVLGLNQTLELKIEHVDLAALPDGTYIGSYDCYRWTNKVEVTVSDHRIRGIKIIATPADRKKMSRDLADDIIISQRNDVDVISGATANSKAFLKAVENSLRNGGNQ